MPTIHWLNEGGAAEAEVVCKVDFADDAMTIDFAHNLYRSVHAYGRSKPGFAIKGADGRCLHRWRWDNDAAADPAKKTEAPQDFEALALGSPTPNDMPEQSPAPRPAVVESATPKRTGRGQRVVAKLLRGLARLGAASKRTATARRRSTRNEASVGKPAESRRFAPEVALKARRWRPEIDHYLLAIIVVLAILCGSPLCSIYATVQQLLRDETFLHQDRTVVALATRDATRSVLATDGKLDFRKLFWHLRVVYPTEIDLLAYEPSDGNGPRLIFQTNDFLRWYLRSVRGADGTWWAKTETAPRAS